MSEFRWAIYRYKYRTEQRFVRGEQNVEGGFHSRVISIASGEDCGLNLCKCPREGAEGIQITPPRARSEVRHRRLLRAVSHFLSCTHLIYRITRSFILIIRQEKQSRATRSTGIRSRFAHSVSRYVSIRAPLMRRAENIKLPCHLS